MSIDSSHSTMATARKKIMTSARPQNAEFSPNDGVYAPDASDRRLVTTKIANAILFHFNELNKASVISYTFERAETVFPGATADLNVFDGPGRLVMQGRDYRSGEASY